MQINATTIAGFQQRLNSHPVYGSVRTLGDLRTFMRHHVYSVWDFMSLIKYLQGIVAPVDWPWLPTDDTDVRRFINELVLEEESDEHPTNGGFASHFQLYQDAMREIGADTGPVLAFTDAVRESTRDVLETLKKKETVDLYIEQLRAKATEDKALRVNSLSVQNGRS